MSRRSSTRRLKKSPRRHAPAIAVTGRMEDGSRLVLLGNLRVVLYQEDDQWIAQGLEIDYAAQGDDFESAKYEFQRGLSATLQENFRVFGHIASVLRPAPSEMWQRVLTPGAQLRRHGQVSMRRPERLAPARHRKDIELPAAFPFPFSAIDYLQQVER